MEDQSEQQLCNEPVTTKSDIQQRCKPLIIGDESVFTLDSFFVPEHYEHYLESLLIPHGMILDRIERLAYEISKDYIGETIHMLCVLKGGSTFFMELCSTLRRFHNYTRQSSIPFTFDFVKVKSYRGCETTGNVEISGCALSALAGRHVLFIEDIIDTGTTMTALMKHMADKVHPASCRVAALVEKRTTKSCGFKGDYIGFSIPDKFIVGFALDYNEVFRDLPHIGVINQAGIEKFAIHTV